MAEDRSRDPDALPRYLKVVIALALLVVLFVIVVDLLTFAAQL